MAEQEYTKKLESLQRYIPFLLNMMGELKAKGNREAQLNKIQSLHDMITNTQKKLKIETLNRCEEVLNNIYFKVNPQLREKGIGYVEKVDYDRNLPGIESPRSTPQSPSPPRDISPTKPITIPTEKIHPRITYPGCSANRPKIDVYSKVVINPSSRPKSPVICTKVPDMSKPPISLDDLKTLEEDVQQKITDTEFVTQSVDQLQEVKKQLQLQLRLEQMHEAEGIKREMALTNPINPQLESTPSHKNQIKDIKLESKHKKEEKKKRDSSGGKSEKKDKKEVDVFGNLLSSIDNKLIEEKKKKKERRTSKEGNSNNLSSHLEKGDKKDNKSRRSSKDKDRSHSSSRDQDKKKNSGRDKRRSKSEENVKKKDSRKKSKELHKKEEEQQENEKEKWKVAKVTTNVIESLEQKAILANTVASAELTKQSTKAAEPIEQRFSDTKKSEKSESIPSDILVGPLKRLADKYNPKPKLKPIEPDMPEVDKSVSESIEKFMKSSPTKLLSTTLLSHVKSSPNTTDLSTSASTSSVSTKPVQLPEILQKFFSKPILGDIIPKNITDPIVRPNTDSRNTGASLPNRLSTINSVTKPADVSNRITTINPLTKAGAIIPPEPPVLSPPHKSVQFQTPRFISPPQAPDFVPDVIRRPVNHNNNPGILGPAPGMLPVPNPRSVLPGPVFGGYTDHAMNLGFGTPRVDFDTPTTPRIDFEAPVRQFEPALYSNNDQFGMNQRFVHPEQQMIGNFVGPSHFGPGMEVTHFNNSYDINQVSYRPQIGEMPHFNLQNQGFYPPERSRWGRDRRPGDPRNYKEYKEMKEQQEKEAKAAQEAQRHLEIKDPRLGCRDGGNPDPICRDPRLSRDTCVDSSNNDQEVIKDPRLSRGREKSVERTHNRNPRDRVHSKTREPHRTQSKERLISRDPRSRKSDNKLDTSKFDKMYSRTNRGRSRSRSQDDEGNEDETFMSPLDSLYNADKGKTGRGYGFQHFKIPRKSRIDDPKKLAKDKKETANRNRISSSSSEDGDTLFVNDSMVISDDEDQEKHNKSFEKAKEKYDTSRIKVVVNKETNIWGSYADLKSPTETEFVSEYDKEFQKEFCENQVETKTNDTTEEPKTSEIEDIIETEEPSSSSPDFEELDSSKNKDEAIVDLKIASSNIPPPETEPEPTEQKILAHFFENLLKSNNKKDKKTALFSLIQTFSDTFDDKEIQKIRKIIKVNEDSVENSDDEKGSNVTETAELPLEEIPNQSEVQEQQPVVGSTTEEDSEQGTSSKLINSLLPTESVSTPKETQVNEVTKSTDLSEVTIGISAENRNTEELLEVEQNVAQSDDSLKLVVKELQSKEVSNDIRAASDAKQLEPIMVSVGERIKNRKRGAPKYKKHKSELDHLHEDIKDMFIRDGVLTATGKRMCRILKDDPNVLKGDKTDTPPATPGPLDTSVEKKVRKKPGPKPKSKPCKEFNGTTIKDMRVVISKIPDTALVSINSLRSNRIKGLRDLIEPEDEENQDSNLEISSSDNSEDDSELEDLSHSESDDEENQETRAVEAAIHPARKKSKRRRGNKWASGVITKQKKKKPKDNVLKENSLERPLSAAQSKASEATDSLSELDDSSKLVEPDKEYYYDFVNKRKLSCKLCKYSGHMMTGHYLREHPQSEVLCSRFSPEVATTAIKDFAEYGQKYESITIPKVSTKYHYTCRMCMYNSFVTPIFFYEHVTTHTGEWRHQCGICEFFAATSKTMASHFQTVHPGEERKAVRRTYTLGIIFAYVCGECNFVQLNQKNVEDHANIFHLGEKTIIHKINMSMDLDPELDKLADMSKIIESSESTEAPKCKKPGPKSKTIKSPPENHDITVTEDSDVSQKILIKKRPGPKSRTLSIRKPLIDEPVIISTPVRQKPGAKSRNKTAKMKQTRMPEDSSSDEESVGPKTRRSLKRKSESDSIDPELMESDSPVKQIPLTKRTRDLANLLNEDSGDDLDTIITLSSRSSRAAKAKATEKLKYLMENNEGIGKRRSEVDSPSKKPNTDAMAPEKPAVQISASKDTSESSDEMKPSEKSSYKEKEVDTSTSKIAEMDPPKMKDQSNQKEDNLSAFTSKKDFLQEARLIEEDRLRKMEELNKSILESRAPKLDFINKLSTRLNNEQDELIDEEQIIVKDEPEDRDESNTVEKHLSTSKDADKPVEKIINVSPITKQTSVGGSSASSQILNKNTVQDNIPEVPQSNIIFPQNKSNSLFSNMIEKLQGKLSSTSRQAEDIYGPIQTSVCKIPNVDQSSTATSELFVFVGDLVKATKIGQEIIYSCHVNGCYVATKDTTVFQLHCKFGHKDLNLTSELCSKCQVQITTTPDTTLLENLYDHLIFAHSEFLLKPSLRMRRMSGDKLSIKKEKQHSQNTSEVNDSSEKSVVASSPNILSKELDLNQEGCAREIEAASTEEPIASESNLELPEDNPFSFKISSVMSLADVSVSSKAIIKTEPKLPPLKLAPQLTTLPGTNKQQSHLQEILIKEVQMADWECNKSKKAQKSLQKLLESPGDLYKCPHYFCSFSSSNCELLRRHMHAHKIDPNSMVPCIYCDVKTPWEQVPMHIDIRHSACRYSCSYCLYRALLKEYVYLHIEKAHHDRELVAITLPASKGSKYSIAEENGDHRALCQPFECSCAASPYSKEMSKDTMYLFENEFLQHMEKSHPNQTLMCGYKECLQKEPSGAAMINHWASSHGVGTYQCGICKYSSQDLNNLYLHFANRHPCSIPSILVRKNYFLPKNREVGYTNAAFKILVRVVKLPENLSMFIRNRNQKNVKLVMKGTVPSEDNQSKPEVQNTVGPIKGISSGTPLVLSPSRKVITSPNKKKSSAVLSSSNVTLLVTTKNNENILLVPALVPPKPGQVLTSTAPINKATVQTSTASEKILKTVPPQPYRFGNITIYPNDNSGVVLPSSDSIIKVPSNLPSTSSPSQTTPSAKDSSTHEENPVSEEDLLQSAIQSILDHEDQSRSTTVTQNIQPELPNVSSPPPLAPISNSLPAASSTKVQTEHSPAVRPLEHIEVIENTTASVEKNPEDVDPLNLEPSEGFNLLIDTNAIDPLADDTLNIEPTSTPDLSIAEESANAIDKNITDVLPFQISCLGEKSTEAGEDMSKGPMKISPTNRSASVVSNSDEDSDSSHMDKKKRGLIGYQLFRCAACNLSFSSLKPFKSHMMTVCKKVVPKCCHCDRVFKSMQRLCEHIMSHGVSRFSCSLCNEKFTVVNIAKLHMKNRHSINQTNLVPLSSNRNDIDIDSFLLKPCQAITPLSKEKENPLESPKATTDENSFTPDQLDSIPARQIFSTNVKCGLCNYQTKVRVNIIRHLQMHLDEKAVPDIAPVNPVPCLEKNEKMFDKMMNFAASSITTSSRMGEAGKEKEDETFPEFVPTHRRFVCCAQGCSYLCLEEGNLKHHIMALHSDETEFTCAHCKVKIEPTDIEHVIKHFKYHGLHLYKCNSCNFVHYLKHKVEGHIANSHLESVVKLVTLRSMDAEPVDQEDGGSGSSTPQSTTLSKFKPWNCCMCKAKYYTKEEIETHAIKKHNIDAQFKCTLCAFKSDSEEACRGHFIEQHSGHEFDIIFVYQKLDEEPVKEPLESFDTTPLWQRDKPRVRHIRGILFDESSPQPLRSPKKKNTASSLKGLSTSKAGSSGVTIKSGPNNTATITSEAVASSSVDKNRPESATSNNLFDCIDAVARGTATILDPSNREPRKSISESKVSETEVTVDQIISKAVIAVSKEKEAPGLDPTKEKTSPKANFASLETENTQTKIQVPVIEKIFSGTATSSKSKSDSAILFDPIDDDVVIIPPKSPNVIVIESDEEEPFTKGVANSPKTGKSRNLKRPGTTDLLQEAVKLAKIEESDDDDATMAQSCSRPNLINLFGGVGLPFNKQWKCPTCNQFKSKRASDFMFHLYKDHKTFRYRCKACSDQSITYKYMQSHVEFHPGFNDDIIERLPPNVKLDTWIHIVIREQSLEILKNAPLFQKRPVTAPTDIKCFFCEEKFMLWPDCWEHMLYHWVMMPYQCQDCPSEFYTVYELRQHNKIVHRRTTCQEVPKGPTLAKALHFSENIKKRPIYSNSSSNLPKKAKLEESQESSILINESASSESTDQIIMLDDDEEEKSKTPSSDESFACRICAFISDIESETVEHVKNHVAPTTKDLSKLRYQVLDKSKCESRENELMACNICDIVLSEIKLRKHFMAQHNEEYAPYKYRCDFCDTKFFVASAAKNHYSRVHGVSRNSFISVGAAKDKKKQPIIYRQYYCTKCSYSVISIKSMSMKHHLKSHYRDMLAGAEGQPEKKDDVIMMVNKAITEELKDIIKAAKEVKSSWEKEESSNQKRIVECYSGKMMARKSTSAPHVNQTRRRSISIPYVSQTTAEEVQDVEAGYSFYGIPQKKLDLSKIETTFEMDDLEYTTTAEQMMKMINMDTYVDMSDCMMDLMPIDFI
ncbi:uncharacterized protein LOC126742791 [Anthonomus grandis grandis]|uniref:uncharacterized protein LOC126742791 n=1 Tax=Anthonomus grandis grandis TaxID=2921223 RepID=UPI0021662FBC|nr:uncharacterized protein LOC126742791 [Anthonomus grandis grandis]XP_050305540.1 uncharacterized protein LOC126742791 [Anthonomus grandis grandis]